MKLDWESVSLQFKQVGRDASTEASIATIAYNFIYNINLLIIEKVIYFN
tara:strand:- start:49 stop:195 length:147 start_codon:yes stop_codon:yes gene_type:complete